MQTGVFQLPSMALFVKYKEWKLNVRIKCAQRASAGVGSPGCPELPRYAPRTQFINHYFVYS
jgi:hypothetical protein